MSLSGISKSALYAMLFFLGCVRTSGATGPVVETTNGPVEGIRLRSVNAFFGIPYAEPPVGDNRWQPPMPANSWKPNVYQAKTVPPGCFQDCFLPPHTCPETVSEDCLYVTVFTPGSATNSSNLPVMLFLHGGNFEQGAAYTPLTDGTFYAKHQEVVMVLPNYRLGAFGFLVTGNKSEDATGNYGILDQRLAMEWVQANIASFGGNPNKVTAFGQSAGAQSVAVHLSSKRSKNLFHRAVIQSAPFGVPFKEDFEAIALGDCFADALDCRQGDMDCLRSKSSDDLLNAQKACGATVVNPYSLLQVFQTWGPHIDGKDVTLQPIDAFRTGHFGKVPIMMGTTSDETRINIFMALSQPITRIIEYFSFIYTFLPDNFFEVVEEYPPDLPGSDQREALIVLANHLVFECPLRAAMRGVAEHGRGGVAWMYRFEQASSFNGWGPLWQFCDGHPCHGIDLPFVFHSARLGGGFHLTPDEETLSRSMVHYWSNMAHSGNPNDDSWKEDAAIGQNDFVHWPKYRESTEWSFMRFTTPRDQVDKDFLIEKCDFWDSLNVYP